MMRIRYDIVLSILSALLLLTAVPHVSAQQESSSPFLPVSFGVNAGFGLHSYGGSVDVGSNVALGGGACGIVSNGSGSGIAFGAFAEYAMSPTVAVGLRGLYEDYSGTMSNPLETTFRRTGFGNIVPVEAEHRLELDLPTQSIEAFVAWQPLEMPLRVIGGPKVAIPTSPTFTFAEELVGVDSEVAFRDGTRRQEFASGSLQTSTLIGFHIGLDYSLPMGSVFSLEPSLIGTIFPTGAIAQQDGPTILSIRPSIGLRYRLRRAAPDPPLLAIVEPRVPPAPPEQIAPLAFEATVVATGPDGIERPALPILVETERSVRDVPVLPYVFFDSGSSDLPNRFRSDDASDAANELDLYRSVLAIVADRMKGNDEKIRLVGTLDREEIRAGRNDLAASRAESVRRYLVDVHGIDPDRITVSARGLPERAANSDIPGAAAENRRVEIEGGSAVLGSVRLTEEESDVTITAPDLVVTTLPERPVDTWSARLTLDGDDVGIRKGSGVVPERTSIVIGPAAYRRLADASSVAWSAEVSADGDRVERSGSLPIDRRDNIREIPLFESGGTLSRPVLFAYNSSRLDAADRRNLEELRDRLAPGTALRITGFADDLGGTDYNRELSRRRAEAVAAIFDEFPVTIVAGGEQLPVAGDTTPEARLLARTVRIEVGAE